MTDNKNGNLHIACRRCRYYQVTYDARRPYGCKAHGFKAPGNPARIVYESSGIDCQLFEAKKQKLGVGSQESEE
jgi:hypothetical protein